MQKIVYHLINKFFMNKVDVELLNYLKNKRKRNQIVPLVEQKLVKKIDYKHI